MEKTQHWVKPFQPATPWLTTECCGRKPVELGEADCIIWNEDECTCPVLKAAVKREAARMAMN